MIKGDPVRLIFQHRADEASLEQAFASFKKDTEQPQQQQQPEPSNDRVEEENENYNAREESSTAHLNTNKKEEGDSTLTA